MAILVEAAVAADIDALIGLLDILFSIEQDFRPDHVAQRRGLELLLASPAQGRILVARDAGHGVVGMVSAQLVISTAIGAPSVWVEDLVVLDAFRDQGVGKALLKAVREWAVAQKAGRIQLLADVDNTPALDFYRYLNWQPTRLLAWKALLD